MIWELIEDIGSFCSQYGFEKPLPPISKENISLKKLHKRNVRKQKNGHRASKCRVKEIITTIDVGKTLKENLLEVIEIDFEEEQKNINII